MIKIQYRVLQVVPDSISQEGRNVIVLGHDGTRPLIRALGLDPGKWKVDTAPFMAIPGIPEDGAWIYSEWIEWFRSLLIEKEAVVAEYFFNELDTLDRPGSSLLSRAEGVIEGTDSTSEFLMDELFKRVIRTPPVTDSQRDFEREIRRVVTLSGVAARPRFFSDVQIQIKSNVEPIGVYFDFFLDEHYPAAFKALRFKNAQKKTLARNINDIEFTFGEVYRSEILPKDRCFLLCDQPSSDEENFLKRLSRFCSPLNVRQEDTIQILRAL